MKLIDVRSKHARATALLYALLEERKPENSISHRRMPSIAEHNRFVAAYGGPGQPYQFWALIEVDGSIVGHVYLTRRNEIGIQIFERYHGKGYGPQAVKLLMQLFGDREYLANIAPGNGRSMDMFNRLGFDICQVTLRREQRRAD